MRFVVRLQRRSDVEQLCELWRSNDLHPTVCGLIVLILIPPWHECGRRGVIVIGAFFSIIV